MLIDKDDIEDMKFGESSPTRFIFLSGSFCFLFFLLIFGIFLLCSCTLSFQNISTHGVATDLVDETQSPTNTSSPNINLPSNL
jgi:hypothetical protein